jgi:hypothetical protein
MLPWVQFKILTAPQWVEKCSHQKKVKPALWMTLIDFKNALSQGKNAKKLPHSVQMHRIFSALKSD